MAIYSYDHWPIRNRVISYILKSCDSVGYMLSFVWCKYLLATWGPIHKEILQQFLS